ncbi:MAG TPA: hypothetical protein VE891_01605 [Allosphingosinicella sp.]|nr:hypothetical protein [Allosphingosinicella sp.]
MKIFRAAALAATLALAACGPKPVDVIQPLSASVRNAAMVDQVDVRLSSLAADRMAKFEENAREKRAAAGLAPVDPAAEPADGTPRDDWSTLPFAQMMELMVKDVTRDRGLSSGRPLRIAVEIDTLKTANAGMTILAGSSDQLAGTVQVLDGVSGEKLAEYYIDVINSHSGLLGLAMRGGGVREKLANEFAGHIAKQLASKKK